jgi:hypothetical protein
MSIVAPIPTPIPALVAGATGTDRPDPIATALQILQPCFPALIKPQGTQMLTMMFAGMFFSVVTVLFVA